MCPSTPPASGPPTISKALSPACRPLAAARPVMLRMVKASQAEEGCQDYVYAEDLFDPGLMYHYFSGYCHEVGIDFQQLMALGRRNFYDRDERFSMA